MNHSFCKKEIYKERSIYIGLEDLYQQLADDKRGRTGLEERKTAPITKVIFHYFKVV